MEKTSVLIVDDHEVVRFGLKLLLGQYEYLVVVGEAQSLEEAMDLMEKHRPRIVIMDVRLYNGSGINGCADISRRFPEASVIMLTSYGDEETVFKSIRAGAKGFVLKNTGTDELIKAIDAAIRGESRLDPVVTGRLLDHLRQDSGEKWEENTKLSRQEQKVLALLAKGKTNKQIAEEIFLSEKTVRNYVSNILNKLNLSNRSEAAVYAVKNAM